MKAFTVDSKDLFDKEKNPKLSLSPSDIEQNKAIPKKYLFEVWIHPKNGGDDHLTGAEVTAYSLEEAKLFLEEYLTKRSAITNDYKFISEK